MDAARSAKRNRISGLALVWRWRHGDDAGGRSQGAGLEVDCERVLRMALLHDWAETRVGDMPKTATEYFGADARKTAETLAFADIVRRRGRSESEYKTLYQDYEERSSLEARLVKAADVIDLLVQACAGARRRKRAR